MMRKLLLFFAMFCVSIGAWAYGGAGQTYNYGLTFSDNSSDTQTINVTTPGALAIWATSDANTEAGGNTGWVWFDESYRPDEMKYTKLVITGTLNADDLAVLQGEHFQKFTLVDMDGATLSGEVSAEQAGVMDFDGAEYVSLPQNMTKAQVKAFGVKNAQNAAFKSAYSAGTHGTSTTLGEEFYVYSKVGGTLKSCIQATNSDYTNFVKKVKYLTVMGNILPADIAAGYSYGNYIDDEGHVSVSVNGGVSNGQLSFSLQATGTKNINDLTTFAYAYPLLLDLSDARVAAEEDLYLSVLGYGISNDLKLKQLILPSGDPNFSELPVGAFANVASLVSCYIPSTVQVIRSYAFAGVDIKHIYTDSDVENAKVDNGCVTAVADDDTETIIYASDVVDQSPLYGSFTFSSNLKLIETYAFFGLRHVKDVYNLATVAPQCQVDAFPTKILNGINGYDKSKITEDKMITREAYMNNTGGTGYEWIAMLHFPASIGSPQVQRYTDPTRNYSTASNIKDDRGNTIYLPIQAEYNRAYQQGTYGYTWNAWNIERSTDGQNAILYLNGLEGNGWTADGQQTANQSWKATWTSTSKYTSFYDVTNNGSYSQPSGLTNYYDVRWDEKNLSDNGAGMQLYPQAVTIESNYIYEVDANGDYVMGEADFRPYAGTADDGLIRYSRKQNPKTDKFGNLVYEPCTDGDYYIKETDYVEDADGNLVQNVTATANDKGDYVLDYTFEEDNVNGTHYHPFGKVPAPENPYNVSAEVAATYYWAEGSYGQDNNGIYVDMEYGVYTREEIAGWNNPTELAKWDTRYADPTNRRSFFITAIHHCNSAQDVGQHATALYQVSDAYAEYNSDVKDIVTDVNDTKYSRKYKTTYRRYNESTDAGVQRYDAEISYVTATDADAEKPHFSETYTYRSATSADEGAARYCPKSTDVVSATSISYTNTNDYRGWHQFVLTGYSANTTVPTAYEKIYTTDTDWWTICLPYDLTRAEAMKLFSDGSNAPYVSKLRYVIRDVTAGTIQLCFTKNLMNYREGVNGSTATESSIVPTTNVFHGGKDDNGILHVSSASGTVADDDVVLHRGVPYLIKPTLPATANHSFQFTLTEVTEGATLTDEQKLNNSLYTKIKGASADAENWDDYIYSGIYTVPALVANNKSEGGEATSGTVTVNGKEYGLSTAFSYSFVGTFFKGLLPQYCYFLGWDSAKNKAAFWYNKVHDPVNWTWSNQTGIICPNYNTSKTITAATDMNHPARWELVGGTDLANDDYPVSSSVGNAKVTTMFFGAEDVSSSTTGISVIKPESKASETTTVYSIDGVRIGNTTESLPKGLYIVNGKKVVVK